MRPPAPSPTPAYVRRRRRRSGACRVATAAFISRTPTVNRARWGNTSPISSGRRRSATSTAIDESSHIFAPFAPLAPLREISWRFRVRESAGSVFTCEQLTGTPAKYAGSEEYDHECQPSPHRHPSASISIEKAEQAAGADCGSTGERTGCARSTGAAHLFSISLDERETASSGGGLARRPQWVMAQTATLTPSA